MSALRSRMFSMRQPTPASHPHLFRQGSSPDELMPGFTPGVFRDRRNKILSSMHETTMVMMGNSILSNHRDVPLPHRQDSNFLYTTGCTLPNAAAIISNLGNKPYFGLILDTSGHSSSLREMYCADEVVDMDNTTAVADVLRRYSCPSLGYTVGEATQHSQQFASVYTQGRDMAAVVEHCRLYKSADEVATIQHASEVAAESFRYTLETIRCTVPLPEHVVSHCLSYNTNYYSMYSMAFPPVVAGDSRSLHPHYMHNNNLVAKGQPVLVDFGVDYAGYVW